MLELGRAYFDNDYRKPRVIDLLWQGFASFPLHYDVQVLFCCASFRTIDGSELSLELSYLHHYCCAEQEIRSKAILDRYVKMNRVPVDALGRQREFMAMPSSLKRYLCLGAVVGDSALVGVELSMTGVFIMVREALG